MTNVVKFPGAAASAPVAAPSAKAPLSAALSRFGAGLLRFVWIVTVLVWPLVKWVLSLDVVFQFARMVLVWNLPNALTFAVHFAVFTALAYFVTYWQPD